MTSSPLRRSLIAGTISLACTLGAAGMVSQAAAKPKTIGVQGYVGQYFPQSPIRNSLTIYMTPTTIMVRNFLGYCGEFTDIRGALRGGKFNVSRQFDNGYGIAFRGRASYQGKAVSGQLRVWGPAADAVVDDPATPEIDETQPARAACDSGFKPMIRMKPLKGQLF